MKKSASIFILLLFILLLSSAGAAYYFYKELNNLKANPQQIAQEENKALIAKVGQLIVLPQDEEPTIATVNDPELLKDRPFFTQAKKGDKLLIYTNAKKAILYDTISHKIIEVAPVNIGEPDDTSKTGAKKSNTTDSKKKTEDKEDSKPSSKTSQPKSGDTQG